MPTTRSGDELSAAYAELGLPAGSGEREIKVAWRRLVSHWHPDRNDDPRAVARLQRLNAALDTLRRRGVFGGGAPSADEHEAPAAPPEAGGAPPAQQRARTGGDPQGRDAHGRNAHGREHDRDAEADAAEDPDAFDASPEDDDAHHEGPADAEAEHRDAMGPPTIARTLKLDLEDAALGCVRPLRGQWRPACPRCEGRGHRKHATACAHCEGRGRVAAGGWFGWMAPLQDCAACGGAGRRRDPCPACDGRGSSGPLRWQVAARIPPGVRDGDRLRVPLPGRRDALDGAEIHLRIALQPHPFLTLREDGVLTCVLPVDGFGWVAGRTVPVPTPSGLQPLALQRDQREYRLPGMGYPVTRRGAPGDLLVQVEPLFPATLTPEQQALLEKVLAAGRGPEAERLAQWDRRLRGWQRRRDGTDRA